jgi:O-antigen ligase
VSYVRRLRGLGELNDPNDLGQALVSALPLLIIGHRPRSWRWLLLVLPVPVGAILWAVILTHSRGAMVALLGIVFVWSVERYLKRVAGLAKIVGAVALLLAMIVSLKMNLLDESARGRVDAWSAGLEMLRFQPIWGVGMGFFTDHHSYVAHNSYVQCFAETGIVGYVLWLSVVLATLRSLKRTAADAGSSPEAAEVSRFARACRYSLVGYLAGALFLSRTYAPFLFLLVALGSAVTALAEHRPVASEAEALPRDNLLGILGRASLGALVSIVAVYSVVLASH